VTLDYTPSNCVISVDVTDYARSVAWYREILGFTVVYELPEHGWCELETPFGFNIGLGQTESVTPGSLRPTFGVSDIDAAIAHLREQDVEVQDWHQIGDMVRLTTFYDPDGTSWMLAQPINQKEARG
jgi:catechol 2,3-dioxygenase-like lactoylglutathione lyase family enzyme